VSAGGASSSHPLRSRAKSAAAQPTIVRVPGAFIAISLEDEAGRPVAGARYRVTGPGGVVREGALDEQGKARVTGVAGGTCQVEFPDLDARAWERAAGKAG
jgi:hypothetical protein